MKAILILLLAIVLVACNPTTQVVNPTINPINVATATPTIQVSEYFRDALVYEEPIVPETKQIVVKAYQQDVFIAASNDALTECYNNPDRYNWKKYAILVGFPTEVVESEEMRHIIEDIESGGDLCSINPNSGAICWVQQFPGSYIYLDPISCMSIGYAKWLDGARNYPDRSPFWQHWYQWWNR